MRRRERKPGGIEEQREAWIKYHEGIAERYTDQSSTDLEARNYQKKHDQNNANKLGQKGVHSQHHLQNTVNSREDKKSKESTLANLVGNDLGENCTKRKESSVIQSKKKSEIYDEVVAGSDMEISTGVEVDEADTNEEVISVASDTAMEMEIDPTMTDTTLEEIVTSVKIKKEMIDNTQLIEATNIQSPDANDSNINSQESNSRRYNLRSNRMTGKYHRDTTQQGKLRGAVRWGENLAGGRLAHNNRRTTMKQNPDESVDTGVEVTDTTNKRHSAIDLDVQTRKIFTREKKKVVRR